MVEISSREIHRAIVKGDLEKFRSFLDSGLDVKSVTETDKWNFLHRALVSVTRSPVLEMIEFLVSVGVDVNARDKHLWTPLHLAARTKNVDVMRILLEAGAEVDPENDDGVTPLRLTLMSLPYSESAIRLLLSNGANPDHEVNGTSVRKYAEVVAHGADSHILGLLG